ncbi:MAG: DUF2804 domain-containing protein [Saccharofermentanales bacterium]|jgi:hypothetical protein
MDEYAKFISEKRRSIPTPTSLVDENGQCGFGTFEVEFEKMELLKVKKPTHAPQFMNRFKLTLWEAAEVHLKEGVLLAVVCDMGIFGKLLHVFYDKRTQKVYCWNIDLKSRDITIAPNLLNGSVAQAQTGNGFVKYVNDFGNGKCLLNGSHADKHGKTIEYDFKLTRLSKPSVVSIPFGRNRPLYSQKDFFKAEGTLTLNGENLFSDEDSVAVVDDHRGYYPRRAHYDWVTTMGRTELNGERKFFALNLTRNQSIDQEAFNENLIWFEEKTSLLPPVKFTRRPESKDFADHANWLIKDDHDMVNIKFNVYGINAMNIHALVVKADYYIAFGELEGYVRDEDGHQYILDGMMGMGEDKTMLL